MLRVHRGWHTDARVRPYAVLTPILPTVGLFRAWAVVGITIPAIINPEFEVVFFKKVEVDLGH